MLLTISSSFEQPFLAVQAKATITPPPNMTRRNTANFHPWSLCGMSFLALGNLATSVVETPRRDAFTRIVLSLLLAFSHAIFAGLLLDVDLDDFTCTWSILRDSDSNAWRRTNVTLAHYQSPKCIIFLFDTTNIYIYIKRVTYGCSCKNFYPLTNSRSFTKLKTKLNLSFFKSSYHKILYTSNSFLFSFFSSLFFLRINTIKLLETARSVREARHHRERCHFVYIIRSIQKYSLDSVRV